MELKINRMKIALMLNYIIVILTIFATVALFVGYRFMYGVEPVLESLSFKIFRLFTVDSNIFVGIMAFIMANKEKRLLTGEIKQISVRYYILKLMATASVTLTFLVVIFYLAPLAPKGIMMLFQNSNFFYHLIIPILSIMTFCFFEKTCDIKLKNIIYSLVPVLLYGIYYLVNILIHIENGRVPKKYDWYLFVQKGLDQIYIIFPLILLITYIITWAIWSVNKKNKK